MTRPNPSADLPSQPIRFWLNGELRSVSGVDPHTSLLDHLREHEGLTGTKEGCAEGDCGACTVALLEAQPGGRVQVRPVNSCIRFLPTVQGQGVLTVEGLADPVQGLHPVQRAMVERHGSQCGFCTPGFVMSLFALFKNEAAPGRQAVCDALAGNLCRCTGYRPIIDAAGAMYRLAAQPQVAGASAGPTAAADATVATPPAPGWRDWLRQAGTAALPCSSAEQALSQSLAALPTHQGWHYEAAGTRFFAPHTPEQLSALLAEHPKAWVLAGGTDVGLWVNKALQDTPVFIWTGHVEALHRIVTTDTHLEIGAAVTLDHAFNAIHAHWPAFAEVWRRFASPPVRASGTLGGNVANGSPIGDSMPVLIALEAEVVLRQRSGQRMLPLEALYLDYKRQAREPGEWVEGVRIPLPAPAVSPAPAPARRHLAAYKISKRPEQDISAVLAAFNVQVDAQGLVTDARLAYGGMAGVPRRAARAEAALLGQPFQAASFEAAAQALAGDFAPIDDMRASAGYRARTAAQLLLRFFDECSGVPHAARVSPAGAEPIAVAPVLPAARTRAAAGGRP
jgi:xanthine dehydrogenase small subunit